MTRELARLLTTLLSKHIDERRTGGMCMSNIECEKMENCFAREDFGQIEIYIKKKLAPAERIRRNCIHFLELQKRHHADTYEIDECLAWLEKQKEPKQEWSEEDEKMRQSILNLISITFSNTYKKEINWLEFLKYRVNFPKSNANSPSWKPSEEQMNELHGALIPGHDFDCDVLASLYDDLKKQMKEEWQ